MKRGKIFVLSGPSGAGKTTLYKKLVNSKQLNTQLVKPVSMTTRPKRDDEKKGRDYFFVSPKMFIYKQAAGHFLESQKVYDYYYGTLKKSVKDLLKANKNVLLCIDVNGAKEIHRKFPEVIRIFIKTPSITVLKERLIKRASEGKQEIQKRLKRVCYELAEAKNYEFIVVNDNLEKAMKDIEKIILSHINTDQKATFF